MDPILEEITSTELSVMEVLWNEPKGVAIRDIVLATYGRHEHSLHATVKSLLDRLSEKHYVTVDKSRFAHRFIPQVSRQAYVASQLKRMAKSHFGGALAPLLQTLTSQVNLSRKDRAALEAIINNIRE